MMLLAVVVALIAVVIGCAAGLVGGSLLAGRTRESSLAREMRRLTEEQRRASEEGRDAAIQAAVHQMKELHDALVEGDRARTAAELDGKKALIDQELHATRDGITDQLQRVDT